MRISAGPEVEPERPRRASHPPSATLLYSLILLMMLSWSLNFVVTKIALREFPPVLLAGLRTALAGALLAPIYFWYSRRSRGTIRRHPAGLRWLLWLGVCGLALNQLFFTMGLGHTSVAHGAILMGLTPVLVLLIAAPTGMERITRAKLAGMGVALAGVAVLNAAPSDGTHATLLGDLFVFIGALAFAVFTVAGKRVTAYRSAISVSTFGYVGSAVLFAPVTVLQSVGFPYAGVSWAAWASLLYMAAFPSVLAYLIFYWALTHIAASRLAAFSYLQPLLATLLAVLLLGETVTLWLIAGGALVLAGVYVTERIASRDRRPGG